ncbi:PadR family transcriptional regulator [Virgibacillus doumboii]|uniref:PadR family transcriptional regulator n=1 Tax=Virgibacillus doumboii TaxID=2697503 RepID=UPI0013E0C55D|nr:PadR family transcriptional regulator [Virgibacillus doumboii]
MTKHNHTTYAILGLLTIGCNSGYAIKQMMDQSLNHFWKISYGQIYPTLKKLVADGLTTVEETQQEGKPAKKEYFITPEGKAALLEWVQSPVDAVPVEKNDVLLKVFFSRHQTHDKTIAQLETYKQKLQERYQTYEAIEEMIQTNLHDEKDAPYWLFTLNYGKRVTAAAMEWCVDTVRTINNWEGS